MSCLIKSSAYRRKEKIINPDGFFSKKIICLTAIDILTHLMKKGINFTVSVELSTSQIAETEEAKGLNQNAGGEFCSLRGRKLQVFSENK